MTLRFGAKLPDFGNRVYEFPLRDSARRAEEAGFDSVWVSDHVVMVRDATSPYPYSEDGMITWDPEEPRLDALVTMATAAAVTDRVEIGVAVLIAAMRNPLVLAKQLATIDALSGGRVALGVGAGWLAEEFTALGVPFSGRGARLDQWIDILRECWSGEPSTRDFSRYPLPDGLLCYPTPAHDIPILVGGMSSHALRRTGARGDGWLAFQRADTVDLERLAAGLAQIVSDASAAGRRPPARAVARITGPLDSVVRSLRDVHSIGFTDVIVEVDWATGDGPRRTLETLREAAS